MGGVVVGMGPGLLPKEVVLVVRNCSEAPNMNNTKLFCMIFRENPTIEIMNAFNVIFMQGKFFHITIHRVHESLLYAGVIQAKGVSKLMGCYKEQTVTYRIYTRKNIVE